MQKQLTEKEKEEIIQELLESNKIKPGQSIDYACFLEIYAPYKEKINEVDFAKILGVAYASYANIKTKRKQSKSFEKYAKAIK